jgi:hypothetical protein
MAAATAQQLIGLGRMQQIQLVDPEPYFFELVLAHEGNSTGKIAGLGNRIKQWAEKTIRAVVHVFSPAGRQPAKIYDGFDDWHGNQSTRLPVGEIVHARLDQTGTTKAKALGWIYPGFNQLREEITAGARDCCSIEVDVDGIEHEDGRIEITEVHSAPGVVLGHTSKQTPGFKGAKVLALQEFGPEEAPAPPAPVPPAAPPTPPPAPVPPPAPAITSEQIIAAVKAANLKPEDFGWTPPAAAPPAPPPVPVPPIPAPPEPPPAPAGATINPFLPE